jgi:hypothetical protein
MCITLLPVFATCPANLILLDVVVIIIIIGKTALFDP